MSALTETRKTKNVGAWDIESGAEILLPVRVSHIGIGTRRFRSGKVERPVFFHGFDAPFYMAEDEIVEVVE